MKNVAIVLSGCGVFDGSEIHETVATMLALNNANISYQCFAPNIEQTSVINHLTQQPMSEKRNVLTEAARIARGDIKDIDEANIADLDAAVYPGGFGAATHFSDFAKNGVEMQMQKSIFNFAKKMADAHKPQAFLCISPILISTIYGPGIKQTIGNDKGTATAIEKMGGIHQDCKVTDVIIDHDAKVVSTPAYMLAKDIGEVFTGVKHSIEALLKLIEEQ